MTAVESRGIEIFGNINHEKLGNGLPFLTQQEHCSIENHVSIINIKESKCYMLLLTVTRMITMHCCLLCEYCLY